MATFISPYTKFGFKRIFGQAEHKRILLELLNVLFEGKYHFDNVTYIDEQPIMGPQQEQRVIHSIFCTLDDGTPIVVEMQNKEIKDFRMRTLYYLSNGILSQEFSMSRWKHPAIGVYFLGFRQADLRKTYRSNFAMVPEVIVGPEVDESSIPKRDSGFLGPSDSFEMSFLQMPEFTKTESECENDFEKWSYIIKNMDTLDHIPWADQNDVFAELAEVARLDRLTPEERTAYEESCACLAEYGQKAG